MSQPDTAAPGAVGSARLEDIAVLVEEAAGRIYEYVKETPLAPLPPEARFAPGVRIEAKLEQLQKTGSFKLRGATNKLLSLASRVRAAGIVTASTGNHGLGVAAAAQALGVDAEIFLAADVPAAKRDRIRAYGARIREAGERPLDAELAARAAASHSGRTYVPPYNDAHVIAGQGTLAVEIHRQAGAVDAVYVATGGGGLISGMGAYLKRHSPGTEVVGCWPANSPVLFECLAAGRIYEVPERETVSDSTAGGIEPGSITLALAQQVIDRRVVVSESEILAAMRYAKTLGWVIEGSAGVALAACLREAPQLAGRHVVVLFCGGNVVPRVAALL
jgi:threonine dehydratase